MILPALLDIGTALVPVTALCWVALMIGARSPTAERGQSQLVALNSVYPALAAFIACGGVGPEQFGG